METTCCVQRLSTESRTHAYSHANTCDVQCKDHHHSKSLFEWKYRAETNFLLYETVVMRSKPWRVSFAHLWKAYYHKEIVPFTWRVSEGFWSPCEMCRHCLFSANVAVVEKGNSSCWIATITVCGGSEQEMKTSDSQLKPDVTLIRQIVSQSPRF